MERYHSSIVKLDCMNNKFRGNIPLPPNLCFGKHLSVLNMGINQLQGSIPSDLGRCATLRRLFLNENNFTGFESNLTMKYMDMTHEQEQYQWSDRINYNLQLV
jgi:hypothetical protein